MKLQNVDPSIIEIPKVRVTNVMTDEISQMFKASIKTHGSLEPILVQNTGGRFILIDGLHRLQEALAAHQKVIQVAVIPGEEKDVYLRNLSTSVMKGKAPVGDEIKVIKHLIEELHMDSDEIHNKTGMTRDRIEKLQVIAEAHPTIREAIDEGVLGVTHAFLIAKVPDMDSQQILLAQQRQFRWTAKELEEHIKGVMEIQATAPPPPPPLSAPAEIMVLCTGCHSEHSYKHVASMQLCETCVENLAAVNLELAKQEKK